MRHAYAEGYSVLPRLRKLAAGELFEAAGANLGRVLAEKRDAVAHQIVFAERDCPPELYAAVSRFLAEQHPLAPAGAPDFGRLALQIPEDLAIHRLDGGRDWLAAAHVCLPSGWRPEEKVGRPLAEVHAPVPGMPVGNSRKLVEAMIDAGPFERFVWGLTFEDRHNGHPRRPKVPFDPAAPRVWVKVERQVTVGFPTHRAALFLMRQHLIPEAEIDRPALLRGLGEMTPEQRRYKGIDGQFAELVAYLSERR